MAAWVEIEVIITDLYDDLKTLGCQRTMMRFSAT